MALIFLSLSVLQPFGQLSEGPGIPCAPLGWAAWCDRAEWYCDKSILQPGLQDVGSEIFCSAVWDLEQNH